MTKMPNLETMKRTLRRQRSNARGNQQEPNNCQNINLNEEILKMGDGSSFLLSDDGQEERIIIFSGVKGKESLRTSSQFFMDGTFKSCSKQFAQVYTVHADLGGPSNETNVFPVVFALLPNKKKETYVRLFHLIKEAVPQWCPSRVNVDFEAAAISALHEVFPSTEVSGCYFHMKKCLWRQIQNLGLSEEYRKNDELKLLVNMCAALAFLKPEDVLDGWLQVHAEAPENPKLTEFFDYFVDTWLDNHQIPIAMWNCYGKRHRTTNAVEGWHNKINSIIGNPHPRFNMLVECLKKEAEHTNCMYMKIELNLEGKKRKKQYFKLDKRIEKTIEVYEETKNIKSCLKAISHIQQLE